MRRRSPINSMKLLRASTLFALVALGLWASTANALPLKIAYDPVKTQPNNNGDATLKNWATASIDAYIANQYPGYQQLPDLGDLEFKITKGGGGDIGPIPAGWPGFGSNVSQITLPLGAFQYVILSWGGTSIPGDHGTADILYYIGGTSGNYTFTRENARGGLSGVSVFGRVPTPGPHSAPDAGGSAGLLGLSLLTLAALRRRLARS